MKTQKIILPAIAVLVGTLLTSPIYAQTYDYHEQENIATNNTKPNNTNPNDKQYLDTGLLYNQISESLPIDKDLLKTQATNSINDNKISAQEQYDFMKLAIECDAQEILKALLDGGFNPRIDTTLERQGLKVTPLEEIALSTNNLTATHFLKILTNFNAKQKTQGEYMRTTVNKYTTTFINDTVVEILNNKNGKKERYIISKTPAATISIPVLPNDSLQNNNK